MKSENGEPGYKFRLGKRLSRVEAIDQAMGYAKSKMAPRFKVISEDETRMIERMAVSNRIEAFVFYVQSRLPDELAEKFVELGASGNELLIYRFASQEKVSALIEEAVARTFYWSNPRATEEFFDWVRGNDGGRVLDVCVARFALESLSNWLGD